jgi:hypothetical protein
MEDEGLGIRSPLSYFEFLPPSDEMIAVLFAIVFIIWAIYSIVAAYHWIRYGHDSWVAFPALLVHVLVSGALMVFTVSGLR